VQVVLVVAAMNAHDRILVPPKFFGDNLRFLQRIEDSAIQMLISMRRIEALAMIIF
jgi:hypothetical protein